MSLHFRSRASALTAFFACLYGVSLAGALLAGCAPADGRTASSPAGGGGDPTLMAAKIQRIRGWEPTGLKTFHLDLPDGLMSADVDAKAPPKVECKNADGDTRSCTGPAGSSAASGDRLGSSLNSTGRPLMRTSSS